MFAAARVSFLFILIISTECIIPDNLKLDFFNIHRHAAVQTRNLQVRPVTPDNVTYYLYNHVDPDRYIKLNQDNLNLLNSKKLAFLIHGWMSSKESQWYEDLKNALLIMHKDYYVVQVDWKEPANQLYYVSSINTYDVAKIITQLLVDLNKNHRVKFEDVLLIGHSLGGHVIGFVGKQIFKLTEKKLPRIIALDPAGPLFTERPTDKRLNKDDAEVVQVIHSDGGTFGYKNPIGTIDFFPNGGNLQPGCKTVDLLDPSSVTDIVTCDHQRAYDYFIEAILNPGEFSAKKCADWNSYKNDECENEEVNLGNLTVTARGNFFLETNKERPFAKSNVSRGSLTQKLLNVFPQLI